MFTTTASAQNQSIAQSLFDQARSWMDQGDFQRACPLFQESHRLDPAGGTVLNLALCHEKQGRTATALSEYHEALSYAIRDKRTEREQFSRERIAEISKAVPKMILNVQEAANRPSLRILLDGTMLSEATWGVETQIDPGSHVIEYSENSLLPKTISFFIQPGASPTVVTIPTPTTFVGGLGNIGALVSDNSKTNFQPRERTTFFYGVLGTALTAYAVSATTGIVSIVNYVNMESDCNLERDYCKNQEAIDAATRAKDFGLVSTVALGIGMAASIALPFLPNKQVSTTIDSNQATFSFSGSF